jgi:hypothetical protein
VKPSGLRGHGARAGCDLAEWWVGRDGRGLARMKTGHGMDDVGG